MAALPKLTDLDMCEAIASYLRGNSPRKLKTVDVRNDRRHGKVTQGFRMNTLQDNTEIKNG